MDSFSARQPTELAGVKVAAMLDFGTMEIHDEEGDLVPKENMFMLTLEDDRRFVIRPSGTEPKIKVYFFGEHRPAEGEKLNAADLPAIKERPPPALPNCGNSSRQTSSRASLNNMKGARGSGHVFLHFPY